MRDRANFPGPGPYPPSLCLSPLRRALCCSPPPSFTHTHLNFSLGHHRYTMYTLGDHLTVIKGKWLLCSSYLERLWRLRPPPSCSHSDRSIVRLLR